MEINPVLYNKESSQQWDSFVSLSKNATFLINRDFLEYHKDRISDYSLFFLKKNEIIGLLPANKVNDSTISSHQGLTYGGIITNQHMSASLMLEVFTSLRTYLSEQGFKELIYKPIPHIYHQIPAEEDLYALFRNNAELIARSVSSCIYNNTSVDYAQLRKRGIKKALNKGVSISESNNFTKFWGVLNTNLSEKYDAKTGSFIRRYRIFKIEISGRNQTFEVTYQEQTIAGCVTFETDRVVHVQYISSTEEARQTGALDLLFDSLIRRAQTQGKHFDFGTSTEQGGTILNEGLISQKEGFGARSIVYDTYRIKL